VQFLITALASSMLREQAIHRTSQTIAIASFHGHDYGAQLVSISMQVVVKVLAAKVEAEEAKEKAEVKARDEEEKEEEEAAEQGVEEEASDVVAAALANHDHAQLAARQAAHVVAVPAASAFHKIVRYVRVSHSSSSAPDLKQDTQARLQQSLMPTKALQPPYDRSSIQSQSWHPSQNRSES
jgi:hypothetical protein